MKKLSFFTFIFTGLLLITSCKKETKINESTKTHQSIPLKSGGGSAYYKNPANPYDTIGQIHNDGIDYIRARMDGSGTPIQDSVIYYAKQFGGILGFTNSEMDQEITYDTTYIANQIISSSNDIDLAFNTMIYNFSTNTAARGYMQLLFDKLNAYTDSTTLVPLMDSIINIEAMFAVDLTISTEERDALFQTAAIMRYSAHYWNDMYYSTNPHWTGTQPDGSLFKKLRAWVAAHWNGIKNVVKADVSVGLKIHDVTEHPLPNNVALASSIGGGIISSCTTGN